MANHKKKANKIMLFLQIKISEKDVNEIIDNKEKEFTNVDQIWTNKKNFRK